VEALALFLTFLKTATLSVGGMSALPLLRQDLVSSGLVTERQVIEALAIGRLTPGPSGLYFVSLGYFAYGLLGAALALVAASIPPLGLVTLAGFARHQLLSGWAAGIIRGVALSTSGLVIATGILLLAPIRDIPGLPLWQLSLFVASALLTIRGGVHPGVLVLGGSLVGLALGRQ
jgi:chromate transporter